MFDKILVANRGEIACRVFKTARRMGIHTVAVYSQADANALHVEMADEAVAIGPAPAVESYLVIDKIVEACRKTGAQAVHPGYGFLSENVKFAEALAAADIAFIGPNARAIEVMGDKIESKKFAGKAGVSIVPGHMGLIEEAEEAVKIATEIGYPVIIKASAGGGGKGMRIAHDDQEAAEGFVSAKSEARSSFGDDRVFIEKFIVNPRHVEIQVLGDKHGNAIHLGERECSIQRRNQKVIEEAPSPLLDEAARAEMGAQAVALAKAVDYDTAGTVEFVADQDKNFYFLEMNTRLQVEHPVTELITGIDLVEQMIRVAAGEKLSLRQDDVTINGWAIESRIYAEDPFRGFMPSIGRLIRYRPPAEGMRGEAVIRNDTGVYEGGEISLFYDPMIAKLCTHAASRAEAIDAMADALDAFYIQGIQHNIPFLAAIMQQSRWREGALTTNYIAEEFPDGFDGAVPDETQQRYIASVAVLVDHIENSRKRQISGQMSGRQVEFSLNRIVALAQDWTRVTIVESGGPVNRLAFDDGEVAIETDWQPGDMLWTGRINGDDVTMSLDKIMNGYLIAYRGIREEVKVYTNREAELAKLMPMILPPDTANKLLCPMPGLVLSIDVAVGDEVKAGQAVAVVEAMKMENILRAERDAVVSAIHAETGDSLAVDAVIMEFA